MSNWRNLWQMGLVVGCIAFVCGCGHDSKVPFMHSKKINVGLQLYSLRADFAKDGVPATLDKVQQYGVTDVEVAGIKDLNAEELQAELTKRHMKASGMHFGWEDFNTNMDKVISQAKALHCKYVTLAWIPHQGHFDFAQAETAAATFNKWGKELTDAGLHFTYHAHGYEFKPTPDGTAFDVLAAKTDKKYANFELDIFWAYDGGADPAALLAKYPDRFPQLHLKDIKKGVPNPNPHYNGSEPVEDDVVLGTGQLDMPGILKQAEKVGVKHYYIEDESKEAPEQIPQSIAYVRSIGY
jgi:sugar phosphate isomerase/epimerase